VSGPRGLVPQAVRLSPRTTALRAGVSRSKAGKKGRPVIRTKLLRQIYIRDLLTEFATYAVPLIASDSLKSVPSLVHAEEHSPKHGRPAQAHPGFAHGSQVRAEVRPVSGAKH
jgi:hypothetical protein